MADCIKHRMADGTIMSGPVHGPNQTCIEWSVSNNVGSYNKGGNIQVASTNNHPLKKSEGGMLVGPTHDNGGIPAIVDGTTPIEVEGGEFVINAQTTKALGEDFLHKLNSTQTEYHTGGFNQGELPHPSKFRRGGNVNEVKRKLQNGGSVGNTPFRKKIPASVVREKDKPCPTGMYKHNGSCFQLNSNPYKTTPVVDSHPQILKEGGVVKYTKKMQQGGMIRNDRNRLIKKTKPVPKRISRGGSQRKSSTYFGQKQHSHTLNLDIDGNGWTSYDLDHEHKVVFNEVQVTCTSDIKCHSH